MTESEWLECGDPQAILKFLRGKASSRKLRLFAVTSCRRILHLMTDARSRAACEVAERYADGAATDGEREAIWMGADQATTDLWLLTPVVDGVKSNDNSSHMSAVAAANAAASEDQFVGEDAETFYLVANPLDAIRCEMREKGLDAAASLRDESFVLVALLRDIYGPLPLRPTKIEPAWLTPIVLALAQCAYDERILPSGELDPERLAVLSDALEEAGCDDAAILEHLRSPGPHVRGCWAVDLLLGRS